MAKGNPVRTTLAALLCMSIFGCSAPGAGNARNPQTAPDPARAEELYKKGLAVQNGGDKAGAIGLYYRAITADPGHAPVLNHLAWLRAADRDPKLRDGTEAVRLAQAACRAASVDRGPTDFAANCLDTLAAAYARAGRFDQAVATAGRAAAMMEALGNRRAARSFRVRQEMFGREQPYRDP